MTLHYVAEQSLLFRIYYSVHVSHSATQRVANPSELFGVATLLISQTYYQDGREEAKQQ